MLIKILKRNFRNNILNLNRNIYNIWFHLKDKMTMNIDCLMKCHQLLKNLTYINKTDD